jgi:hypothetical protein
MIFFGRVSPAGILELDHPELYSDSAPHPRYAASAMCPTT